MRSYEAARSLFSFLGVVAWSVVVIGVLVAFISATGVSQYAGGGAGLLAMVPGVGIAIAGFIQVAFIQMGRATVDTAEYTQQMLKISRDQLEISKQGLNQGKAPAQGFAAAASKREPASPAGASSFSNAKQVKEGPELETAIEMSVLEYKGRTIAKEGDQYIFAKMAFSSFEMAKQYIDRLGVNPRAKLDGHTRK